MSASSLRGVEGSPSVDLTDTELVAAIQAWLPDDDPPVFSVAKVLDQATGFLWFIPKTGAPYSATGAVPDAFVRSATVTLVAGTATLNFITALPSADYRVALSWEGDETIRVTSKLNGSVTVTSSDSSSTNDVDITINRQPAP